MLLDGHIHIEEGTVNAGEFHNNLQKAGIDGGVVLSLSPNSFYFNKCTHTSADRLDNLFSWVGSHSGLYPFYWIDPMEDDAAEQVYLADKYGVCGFKIICNNFFPGCEKAMQVYREIAKTKKPILFHSGIIWNGQASSRYNRPCEFEDLLEIIGLRFSLAHVSWPWCDENIAVYGKFKDSYSLRPELNAEMFIDLTPGTPPIYRREVLTKLLTVGYDIDKNLVFGTDCMANHYNCAYAREWADRDNVIYTSLGIDDKAVQNIFSGNLKRFLGN